MHYKLLQISGNLKNKCVCVCVRLEWLRHLLKGERYFKCMVCSIQWKMCSCTFAMFLINLDNKPGMMGHTCLRTQEAETKGFPQIGG